MSGIRSHIAAASPAVRGLLLVRFFFGVTFVYAGLDKLLDPNFFNPASATSIQAQFVIFERVSPLAPLVRLAEPYAVVLGLLIALGEIGAGLGALTGLCFRLAALGGAMLSLMFFLTASWTTRPYYLGPDLPYAVGWLALLVAGHGGVLVPSWAVAGGPGQAAGPVLSRRSVVQLGALTGLTLLVGSVAGLLRLLLPPDATVAPTPTPTRVPVSPTPAASSPTPTPVASGSPAPTATAAAGQGIPIATVAQVEQRGSLDFQVPISAPAEMFPGDPAVIVSLTDGTFAAYDAICTHAGCTVEYVRVAGIIGCPCHGAEFDPANHGRVLQGPARRPLVELPLIVDTATGTISLATG